MKKNVLGAVHVHICLVWVMAFLFPCSLSALSGEDWYQFHGPHRDRISSESGWLTKWDDDQPAILWKKSIGTGFASTTVVGNQVFTMGNSNGQDTVWCFDADSGKELWTYAYACDLYPNMHEGGPCGTPTVSADAVYTVSKDGQMYCLNKSNGKVKWFKNLPKEFGAKTPTWKFSVSPLLEGDLVIIDVGPAIALKQDSGDLVWKTKDYKAAYSSPVAFDLNGKRCIAIIPQFGLVLLDAKDGKEISKFAWKTKYGINAATPLVAGNKFFLSSGYGKGGSLVAFENGQLKELWHNRLMRNHMNSSILWKGYLYGFDESSLKCIDFNTGKDVWKERGLGKGSLMLADGKLIVLSERGELVIAPASEKGFNPIARKKVLSGKCWTIPVLSHGRIYCRNAAGDYVCVDVRQ